MKLKIAFVVLTMLVVPVRAQVSDRIINGEQLCAAHRSDVLSALRLLAPEVDGDMLLVVDGARLPMTMLPMLSVYDIEEVRVLRDPQQLMRWGTRHQAVLLLTTRKMRGGTIGATYRADGAVQTAVDASAAQTPTQTGLLQHHQLDVEGRDSTVGYLFSAYGQPHSCGVLKGVSDEGLGLRTYISYRRQRLSLHNDLGFRHEADERSQEVRYVRADSEGSFLKSKTARLTDRLGVEFDICRGLLLRGDFSFCFRRCADDLFLSPRSGWFADVDDALQRGSYHKRQLADRSYEGSLLLNFRHEQADHRLTAEVGTDLYSGEYQDNSYGGAGVLNDRMAYISFTLGYDTAGVRQASRQYERTLTGWGSATYEYRQRYGLSAGATVWHSSILSPEHRTALHGYAQAYWNLHREAWLACSDWRQLTLGYTHGVTGFVSFATTAFTTNYQNRTTEQYIYNYYLTGTRLVHEADETLKPARITTEQLTLNAAWRWHTALLRLYHQETAHAPLPVNNGVELTLQSPLCVTRHFMLTASAGIQADHVTQGHLSLGAQAGPWDAHIAISGDDDFGQSALQLNYSFRKLPRWLRTLQLGASVVNLVCWQPDGVLQTRQYLLSLTLAL